MALPAFGSAAGNTGAFGAVGLGLDIYGSLMSANAENKAYQESEAISATEEQINSQRQQQMNLQVQRQQLQNVRTVQQARAAGLATAANSGANVMGSGADSSYKAGQANAAISGARNEEYLSQNQAIGNKIFSLTGNIYQDQILMAQDQSKAATGQAWAGIGGALMGAAGGFGQATATS